MNMDSGSDSGSEEEKVPEPAELWELLLTACKVGDEFAVKDLLQPAPPLEGRVEIPAVVPGFREEYETEKQKKPWPRQWGPLQWAVGKNYDSIVNILLQAGFGDIYKVDNNTAKDVKQENNENDALLGFTTPLHWSAFKGLLNIMCDLIEFYNYDPDIRDDLGNTALHLAASGVPTKTSEPHFVKCVEILLSFGSSTKAKNIHGNTPIQLCTNEACRNLLLAYDINESTDLLLSISKRNEATKTLNDVSETVAGHFDTTYFDDLFNALDVAKKCFVHSSIIERGETLMKTLEAKKDLERSISLKNLGPCESLSDTINVRNCFEKAIEQGVDEDSQKKARQVLDASLAELKLNSILTQCQKIVSHELLKGKLIRILATAKNLNANEQLLKNAELRLTKMTAEMTLKECFDNPWEPSDSQKEGKEDTEIVIMTIEKQLDKLKDAYKKGSADGVGADKTLLKQAQQLLKDLEQKKTEAHASDAARVQEEEEAAEAAKNKKKKKKK